MHFKSTLVKIGINLYFTILCLVYRIMNQWMFFEVYDCRMRLFWGMFVFFAPFFEVPNMPASISAISGMSILGSCKFCISWILISYLHDCLPIKPFASVGLGQPALVLWPSARRQQSALWSKRNIKWFDHAQAVPLGSSEHRWLAILLLYGNTWLDAAQQSRLDMAPWQPHLAENFRLVFAVICQTWSRFNLLARILPLFVISTRNCSNRKSLLATPRMYDPEGMPSTLKFPSCL